MALTLPLEEIDTIAGAATVVGTVVVVGAIVVVVAIVVVGATVVAGAVVVDAPAVVGALAVVGVGELSEATASASERVVGGALVAVCSSAVWLPIVA